MHHELRKSRNLWYSGEKLQVLPSTLILVSNIILQQKEPGFRGEMADSRTGVGNI